MEEKEYKTLVAIRQRLHARPELSGEEVQTTAFLREQMAAMGISILEGGLETGLVAQIGSGEPVIALRADIDALPITENTGLSYSSKNPGVMHACGHDLHMTGLLGAARVLKSRESELEGTIKLIFQPAEETGTGAKKVIATGLLEDVQAFIGYHNIPTVPVGTIGLREKGTMAAVERFAVTLKGLGSHAAYPHEGRDPIVALSAVVQSLQSIVARDVPPLEAAVVSVTHISAGETWNVLPETAFFEGTIRSFDAAVRDRVKARFVEIIENTARAYAVEAVIDWKMSADLTYNDPELTRVVFAATQTWNGDTQVLPPSSAGEDFANYRTQASSVFALIGSNGASAGLHQAEMMVRDETIPIAVDYYVHSALALLDHLK